jgi:hypothetical protein
MPPTRRSPVITGALIAAVLVIAADVWFFALHRRPHAQPAPPPLPSYVVLPATAPAVHPVLPDPPPAQAGPAGATQPLTGDAKPGASAPQPVAASATASDAKADPAKARHHSHHHHSRSSH